MDDNGSSCNRLHLVSRLHAIRSLGREREKGRRRNKNAMLQHRHSIGKFTEYRGRWRNRSVFLTFFIKIDRKSS